jgi:hypothetical protein
LTALAAAHRASGNAARFSDRLCAGLLWLIGLSSGFVLIEPAPYEFLIAIAILVFAVTGLSVRTAHVPLMLLLILYNVSYAISVVPVIALPDTAKWTAVSCFLAITTLFFALALTEDTERRLDLLMKGYVASAVIVSAIGVLAYFRLIPSADTFIFASRAKSTFKDPNVFGPFLVLPGLILMQRVMLGRLRDAFWNAPMLLLIAAALLLSFSRGAWGHFAASAVVLLGFTALTSRSAAERMRIVLFALAGAALLAVLIVVLASLPQVSGLFQERASLVQSYDAGHTGRFGRHILGALMIFDHPIGIGPLQFSKYFPEDPHNSFLDAFMAGGWLGGVTFATLVLVTLFVGLHHVFTRTPWQTTYIAVYATFVGEVGESYLIDVQHWRHYFLIMGVLWGLIAANLRLRSKTPVVPDRPVLKRCQGFVAPVRAGQYSPPPFGA